MTRPTLWIALLALVSFATSAGAQEHPLGKDRTGMRWVLPFTTARAAATQRSRLMMIKPVAFGTSRDGGW